MKKETVAAIFFGVLLGVGGALFMIVKARQISSQNTNALPNTKNITPVITQGPGVQLLEVSEPKNLSIFEGSSISIKGKASKGALVVVQSPIREVALVVEKDSFSTEFPLALGENVIAVNVYAQDSKTPVQQKILKIYYLDEK